MTDDTKTAPTDAPKATKKTEQKNDGPDNSRNPTTVQAVAPGTEPTQEQLDNAPTVAVAQDPNDPDLAGNQLAQDERDTKLREDGKKAKEHKLKVPNDLTSEHYAVLVRQNAYGIPVIRVQEHGQVGGGYEIPASQIEEFVGLLSKL